MQDDEAIFRSTIGTYLTAGEDDIPTLKADIERNTDKAWPDQFKSYLRLSADGQGLSAEDYTRVTDREFDEPGEYEAWLNAIWSYLYEDGDHPA